MKSANSISRRDLLAGGSAFLLGAASMPIFAAEKKRGFAEEVFSKPRLFNINLKISEQDADSLRKDPRMWVDASGMIDGQEMPHLGIHLKGTTSFMPLDKKPSFTL